MAKRILVLDDGDTWAGDGDIYTITDDAYDRLLEGARIRDLDDSDILDAVPVYEQDKDKK